MSPITAQATACLLSRQALRVPVRQHVFRRTVSVTSKSNGAIGTAPADWGRIIKSRTQSLAIYFPAMGLALGWPFLAAWLLDGRTA